MGEEMQSRRNHLVAHELGGDSVLPIDAYLGALGKVRDDDEGSRLVVVLGAFRSESHVEVRMCDFDFS